MKYLFKKSLPCLLCLIFTIAPYSYAVEFGYQGTHILTHGALEDLAKAFQKKYGIRVFVKGGGCADGIAVVVNNRYEMGGLCCPLNPEASKKHNLISHRVATDIKAVIVNPKNPLKNLTLKQISDIHKGKIVNWGQVGIKFDGKDRPIALVYRDHCRDMVEPVRRLLEIKGKVAQKAIAVKTDQEIVKYVENFSSAIGVVSRIFAEKANVKIINIDGVAPTPENAERGLYHFTGDLYIVTKERLSPNAKKFIEFVLSDDGQRIIGRRFARVR
jgi:phosphate transport system substrate-binding protein